MSQKESSSQPTKLQRSSSVSSNEWSDSSTPELEANASSSRTQSTRNPFRHDSPTTRDNAFLEALDTTRSSSSAGDRRSRVTRKATLSGREGDNIGASRLVVAVDFGTTFTGLAYAQVRPGDFDMRNIVVVKDWGRGMDNLDKVPSLISFSDLEEDDDDHRQWGLDISPKAVVMPNIKLELDLQDNRIDELELLVQMLDGMKNLDFEYIRTTGGIPEYPYRSPTEIVTDYLREVVYRLHEALDADVAKMKLVWPLDLVITIPVRWSYAARNATVRAIQDAGLNSSEFKNLNSISLVTEPEAAALYTARYCAKEDRRWAGLKVGDYFVLCDAGGGTVDTVAYRVRQLNPVLELEEASRPTNDKCGASYISLNFKGWFREQLPDIYDVVDDLNKGRKLTTGSAEGGAMRKIMAQFEVYKKNFTGESNGADAKFHIDLPDSLQNLNVPHLIQDGVLIITSQQMQKFFDICIEKIITLVRGHMSRIKSLRGRTKTVFLVGGFGANPFLQQMLTRSFRRHREQEVQLKLPDTSWTAVVRGAVLHGVLKTSKPISLCPAFYGIHHEEQYIPGHFASSDLIYTNPANNQQMIRGQYRWIIKKGDILPVDEERVEESECALVFTQADHRTYSIPVLMYKADDPPSSLVVGESDLVEVGSLSFSLKHIPLNHFDVHLNESSRHTYYVARLICRMTTTTTTLKAEMLWEDAQLSKMDMKIDVSDSYQARSERY